MKKRVLKNWIVKLLVGIVVSYVSFIATTIDSIGNRTYNKVFAIFTIIALVSIHLLKKYSRVFED